MKCASYYVCQGRKSGIFLGVTKPMYIAHCEFSRNFYLADFPSFEGKWKSHEKRQTLSNASALTHVIIFNLESHFRFLILEKNWRCKSLFNS